MFYSRCNDPQIPVLRQSLEKHAIESDFAVLIVGPDDKVTSRGEEHDAPRDNVIFELGLFMGSLLRERTLIVKPRGINLKIPTDLIGLTPLEYHPPTTQEELAAELGPICTQIAARMDRLGPK